MLDVSIKTESSVGRLQLIEEMKNFIYLYGNSAFLGDSSL